VISGSMCTQDTERPTGQLVSQLALAGTSTSHPPPGISPRNLSLHAATMLNLHARSPSHELENLQGESAHGEMHVTSAVTSRPGPGALIAEFRGIFTLTAPDASPPLHRFMLIFKLCASTLPATTSLMPRLRGKSRRGAAWYAARGRKMPNSAHLSDTEMPCADIPPVFDALPVLPPLLAHAPTETQLEATQELSPLSNEYGCRVEWFDAFGNSLGYAPPPPSPPPPRQPPPAFNLSRYLSEATSATPTDSPFRPPCHNHANQEEITQALSDLAKGQQDIKTTLRDLQTQDEEQRSRVDKLLLFLQDLRQASAERDKGKLKNTQVFAGPSYGPGL
jgi:hypothetical protein